MLTSDGMAINFVAINFVAIAGEFAAPKDRATVVTPEAAERSSGDTNSIVQACRVGTSICEMGGQVDSQNLTTKLTTILTKNLVHKKTS